MKHTKGGKKGGTPTKSRNRRVTRQSGQITPNFFDITDSLVDTSEVFQHLNDDGTMSVTWTPESEIILFKAMIEHKLVGIKKHFNVITVVDLLSKAFGFKVNPKTIWEHVNSLYEAEQLEENYTPVIGKQSDFALPKSFDSIIAQRSRLSKCRP